MKKSLFIIFLLVLASGEMYGAGKPQTSSSFWDIFRSSLGESINEMYGYQSASPESLPVTSPAQSTVPAPMQQTSQPLASTQVAIPPMQPTMSSQVQPSSQPSAYTEISTSQLVAPSLPSVVPSFWGQVAVAQEAIARRPPIGQEIIVSRPGCSDQLLQGYRAQFIPYDADPEKAAMMATDDFLQALNVTMPGGYMETQENWQDIYKRWALSLSDYIGIEQKRLASLSAEEVSRLQGDIQPLEKAIQEICTQITLTQEPTELIIKPIQVIKAKLERVKDALRTITRRKVFLERQVKHGKRAQEMKEVKERNAQREQEYQAARSRHEAVQARQEQSRQEFLNSHESLAVQHPDVWPEKEK